MYCTTGGTGNTEPERKSKAARRPASEQRLDTEDSEKTQRSPMAHGSPEPLRATPTPETETVWSTLDIDDPITEATEATTPVNRPWRPDLRHSKGNARSATNISL